MEKDSRGMVLMEKNGRKEIVWPGRETTGFSKNSAKVGVNGEKQRKAARKVSGVEDKWGTHGDRKRNVGEKRRSENGSWWTAWKNKMSDLP